MVNSIPGLLLLLSALFLYFFTYRYLWLFNSFVGWEDCVAMGDLVETPHYWVMVHSWVELALGTVVFFSFASAIVIKLTAILSYVLCPLQFLKTQRCCVRKCTRVRSLGIDQMGEMTIMGMANARKNIYQIPEEEAGVNGRLSDYEGESPMDPQGNNKRGSDEYLDMK
jgi:FlaA1/EpsC-like NDP-sugar epimerase